MKKALKRILAILLVLVIAAGVIGFIQLHTPEYALYQTVKDMQKSGYEGLQKHLTAEADQKLDSLLNNTLTQAFMTVVGQGDQVNEFIDRIQELDWEMDDMLKGKKRAEAEMSFKGPDDLNGSMKVSMIREDHEWKISGISDLTFE